MPELYHSKINSVKKKLPLAGFEPLALRLWIWRKYHQLGERSQKIPFQLTSTRVTIYGAHSPDTSRRVAPTQATSRVAH